MFALFANHSNKLIKYESSKPIIYLKNLLEKLITNTAFQSKHEDNIFLNEIIYNFNTSVLAKQI